MASRTTKYFTVGFIMLILYLSALMFQPFYTSILGAMVLSYLSYPLFKRINKYVKNQNLAIFLMVTLVLAIIILPLVVIMDSLLSQMVAFYSSFAASDFTMSIDIPERFAFMEKYAYKAVEDLSLGRI